MSTTHLQLEPTTRCNFTCGFCCGRKMEQNDLSYETFIQTLTALPNLSQIELQGEGESLMHPRFFEMVDFARSRNVRVSFITNGSFFGEEAVRRILDAGVEKISVSLESADAETFRAIRGGKLEKVIRGIELLLTERKRRGLDRPVVGFSVTVLDRTQDHLDDILSLYERLGLDGGITMQPLQHMPIYTAAYDETTAREMLSPEDVDRVWVRFRSHKRVKKIQKRRHSDLGFHDDLMAGWNPSQRKCPWLEKGLYVDRNGVATACCMVKEERFALGRIGRDSMADIEKRRDEMRAELARGVVPEACGGCELARFAVTSKLGLVLFAIAGLKERMRGKPAPKP